MKLLVLLVVVLLLSSSVMAIKSLKCPPGQYIANKFSNDEMCELCPTGTFSKNPVRNKKCKKCKRNTFSQTIGSTRCKKCPKGFSTKKRKGKDQCWNKKTGESMEELGFFDEEDIEDNEKM